MTVLDLDDLFAPEVNADPFTYFAHLREADPVHWNERFQLWVVTRYEDVVWLLRHHEFFSSAVIKTTTQPPYPPVDPEDVPLFDDVRRFRALQAEPRDRRDGGTHPGCVASLSPRGPRCHLHDSLHCAACCRGGPVVQLEGRVCTLVWVMSDCDSIMVD